MQKAAVEIPFAPTEVSWLGKKTQESSRLPLCSEVPSVR